MNIPQEERAQFDNYREISGSLGNIIGGALVCVSLLTFIDYRIMWIFIYVMFDLNMIALMLAIKYNKIKY